MPSGTQTWNTALTVTKHISIIGGYGGGTTTVVSGTKPVLRVSPSNDNNSLLRVSNITFDNNGMTGGGLDGTITFEGSYSFGVALPSQVRVDHCTFIRHTGYGAIFVRNFFYGVVDNCSFGTATYPNTAYYSLFLMGNSDNDLWWGNYPFNEYELGSYKNVYFEDNKFYHTNNDSIRVSAGQYGCRGAYRYNTIYNSTSDGVWETHGYSNGQDSCFGMELYGNLFIVNQAIALVKTRGGSSLYFNNTVSGTTGQMISYAYSDVALGDSCSPGYPNDQSVHDTYTWNNRNNYNGTTGLTGGTADLDGCGTYNDRPLAGRDIVGDTTSPASATAGSSLPGTCTTGSSYWLTTQSTTDLTNLVGDKNTNPNRLTIIGDLYKCTSTNTWTWFFTPYNYPHPLRNEIGDTTAPVVTIKLPVEFTRHLLHLKQQHKHQRDRLRRRGCDERKMEQ